MFSGSIISSFTLTWVKKTCIMKCFESKYGPLRVVRKFSKGSHEVPRRKRREICMWKYIEVCMGRIGVYRIVNGIRQLFDKGKEK